MCASAVVPPALFRKILSTKLDPSNGALIGEFLQRFEEHITDLVSLRMSLLPLDVSSQTLGLLLACHFAFFNLAPTHVRFY